MRVTGVLIFTVVLASHGMVFAQKAEQPGVRKSSPTDPTLAHRTRRSHGSNGTTAPKASSSSSSNDLAKIEQSGIKRSNATHPTRQTSTESHVPGQTGAMPQEKNKPMRFSSHQSQASSKQAGNNRVSGASTRPPKGSIKRQP